MRRLRRRTVLKGMALGLVVIVVLAGCGGDNPAPTPTATPRPAPTYPPTWTPSPVVPSAIPVTVTPLPTITPLPTATATPGPTPGAVWRADEVVVTVLQADLNAAVARAFAAQPNPTTTSAPLITLAPSNRIAVDLAFYDDFLDEASILNLMMRVDVGGQQVRLIERRQLRLSSGAMVSDRAVWPALDMVEAGINAAIQGTLQTAPGADSLQLGRVLIHPDNYLEAVFVQPAAVE